MMLRESDIAIVGDVLQAAAADASGGSAWANDTREAIEAWGRFVAMEAPRVVLEIPDETHASEVTIPRALVDAVWRILAPDVPKQYRLDIGIDAVTVHHYAQHAGGAILAEMIDGEYRPRRLATRFRVVAEGLEEQRRMRSDLAAARFGEREWRSRAHDLEADLDAARAELAALKGEAE